MKRLGKVLLYLLAGIFILPIVYTFVSSFMGAQQLASLKLEFIPKFFSLDQYYRIAMFKSQYFIYFLNSIKITGLTILFQLIIGVSAAYALAKLEFNGKRLILLLYIVVLLLPFQVTFVPNFLMMRGIEDLFNIKIFDTHYAIILPGVFTSLGVFLLRQFIMDIPNNLMEAARIDGASEFRIFFQIVLPVIRPAVITLVILTFIDSWNAIEQVIIFIESALKMPLSVFLEKIYYEDPTVFFAGAVLYTLPAIYLFVKFEKYLEDGFSLGGKI